jgi:hypothetical protein
MHIALSSSSNVEVFIIGAGSQRNLRDSNLVLALGRLQSWGSDVCGATPSGTECTVAMVSNKPLTDNFSVAISIDWLVYCDES